MTNETIIGNFTTTINDFLSKIHLIYLGLLPSIATFYLLSNWPRPEWLRIFIFMGGVGLVGVYLAVVVSYAGDSKNFLPVAIMIADGPFFAWLSGGSFVDGFDFGIRAFLIDGLAIWLIIALLAIITDRPTTEQAIASVFIAICAIGTMLILVRPVLPEILSDVSSLWLIVGMAESLYIRYLILDADQPTNSHDTAFGFILVMIIIWIAAMIGGSVMGDIWSTTPIS